MWEAMSAEDVGDRKKPMLNTDGLAGEWEQNKVIREYLRQEGNILFDDTTESVKSACRDHVHAFLLPMLTRMAATPELPQPPIEALRDQLTELYRRVSKLPDESQVIKDSWFTRKYLGFVKMKTRIQKPSKVPWFDLTSFLNPRNPFPIIRSQNLGYIYTLI